MTNLDQLVIAVIGVEVVIASITIIAILAHAIWLERYVARRDRMLRVGSQAIGRMLSRDARAPLAADDMRLLRDLPRNVLRRAIIETAAVVSIEGRRPLREVAGKLQLIADARRELLSRSWVRRLHAARVLNALGVDTPEITLLLDDEKLEVRSQAAEWAADHPNDERVEKLLQMLGDPAGLCRFTVEDTLIRIGHRVVPRLAAYLAENRTPRELEAALRVATRLPSSQLREAAARLCNDQSAGVGAAATTLLAAVGGPEAAAQLRHMLTARAPEVRAAAAQALGKVNDWRSAANISALLTDQAFQVRRNAALALRAFGPPGMLFLDQALRHEDAFARDMARQVLDLPDSPTRDLS